MKKLVLFAAIAAISVSSALAQEVKLGAKAGVNFSTFSGDDLGDVKSRTGFHIGALVEIPVSERFSVQPEILYSAQGAKYEERGPGPGEEYFFKVLAKLDYIQVPIMAKFYVMDGLALEAGPQISFLASKKGEIEATIGGVTVSSEEDLDNISSIDFSLGAGASYRLPMGVFFGARYNFGLSNVNDSDTADNFKMRNNVFQLSAGYSF